MNTKDLQDLLHQEVKEKGMGNFTLEDYLLLDYLSYRALPDIVDTTSLRLAEPKRSYNKARRMILNTGKSFKIKDKRVVNRKDLIESIFSIEAISRFEQELSEKEVEFNASI